MLEYRPRRVYRKDCGGVRTELVPWAPRGSGFTWEFEELIAYLAQVTDKAPFPLFFPSPPRADPVATPPPSRSDYAVVPPGSTS